MEWGFFPFKFLLFDVQLMAIGSGLSLQFLGGSVSRRVSETGLRPARGRAWTHSARWSRLSENGRWFIPTRPHCRLAGRERLSPGEASSSDAGVSLFVFTWPLRGCSLSDKRMTETTPLFLLDFETLAFFSRALSLPPSHARVGFGAGSWERGLWTLTAVAPARVRCPQGDRACAGRVQCPQR